MSLERELRAPWFTQIQLILPIMGVFLRWHLQFLAVLLLVRLGENNCSLFTLERLVDLCHRAYNKQSPKHWIWTQWESGWHSTNKVVPHICRPFPSTSGRLDLYPNIGTELCPSLYFLSIAIVTTQFTSTQSTKIPYINDVISSSRAIQLEGQSTLCSQGLSSVPCGRSWWCLRCS